MWGANEVVFVCVRSGEGFVLQIQGVWVHRCAPGTANPRKRVANSIPSIQQGSVILAPGTIRLDRSGRIVPHSAAPSSVMGVEIIGDVQLCVVIMPADIHPPTVCLGKVADVLPIDPKRAGGGTVAGRNQYRQQPATRTSSGTQPEQSER